jgi:hypothetical protein
MLIILLPSLQNRSFKKILIALSRNFNVIMTRSGMTGHLYLAPALSEKAIDLYK